MNTPESDQHIHDYWEGPDVDATDVMPDPLEHALDGDLTRPDANALIRDAVDVANWFRIWKAEGYPKSGQIEMADAVSRLTRTLLHIIPEAKAAR